MLLLVLHLASHYVLFLVLLIDVRHQLFKLVLLPHGLELRWEDIAWLSWLGIHLFSLRSFSKLLELLGHCELGRIWPSRHGWLAKLHGIGHAHISSDYRGRLPHVVFSFDFASISIEIFW